MTNPTTPPHPTAPARGEPETLPDAGIADLARLRAAIQRGELRPVRDPDGRLRMEWVEPYVPSEDEIKRALASLAKAWPVLADHASHIDGEFDNALSNVRRMFEALRDRLAVVSAAATRAETTATCYNVVVEGALSILGHPTESDLESVALTVVQERDAAREEAARLGRELEDASHHREAATEALAIYREHLAARDAELAGVKDLLEAAWVIIANAGGGDWDRESAEWKGAAVRWREQYHSAPDRAIDAARSGADKEGSNG